MSAQCCCTFRLGGLWFGVAVERVQEVISSPAITPVPLAPREIAGLTNLRGQIVTVINLARRLGIEKTAALPSIVAVEDENALVGLLVEELGEVVEVPENMCEAPPGNLPLEARELVPAVGKFPGRLLHLLDLDKVLARGRREVLIPGR